MESIVVFMFLLVTIAAAATEPSSKLLTEANSKSLIFELDTQGEETTVKLIDINDEVLYHESILGIKQYRKKFDFSELKLGEYFLAVENSLSRTVHSLNIGKDAVIITGKTDNNKPYFKKSDKHIGVNFLNLKGEQVSITIYDSENRTVFKEEFNKLRIEKAFNFERAYADNYAVVVKTNKKIYSEHILIE